MPLPLSNGIYIGDLIIRSCGRTLALEQLSRLPHAPSVGLHDVPSESVGTHIGLKDYDELDERLAREYLCSGLPLNPCPIVMASRAGTAACRGTFPRVQ